MTDPDTISADYTLRPSELAATLALLVEARQTTMVWGPPGSAKSQIAQQVAAAANRQYVDVRTLLLDPVDLRGIPWRDSADRTQPTLTLLKPCRAVPYGPELSVAAPRRRTTHVPGSPSGCTSIAALASWRARHSRKLRRLQ